MLCRSRMNGGPKQSMMVGRGANVCRSVSKSEVQVSIAFENRSETSHFCSALFESMRFGSSESVLHSRATPIEDHRERRVRVKENLISGRCQGGVRKKIARESRFVFTRMF